MLDVTDGISVKNEGVEQIPEEVEQILSTMIKYDWQPSTGRNGRIASSPMRHSNGRPLLTRPRGGLAIRTPHKPQQEGKCRRAQTGAASDERAWRR